MTATPKTIDLTDHAAEMEELLRLRRESKAIINSHKAIVENTEKRLRDLLGDADEGFVAGVRKVWLSHATNTGVDRHELLRIAPSIYQQVFRSTPYTKLFGR